MQNQDSVKGWDIARAFFLEWGLPELQRQFPALVDRVAGGKMLGSDVLGADDAISRDHNWGPQFWLFLSDTDYTQFGQVLSERLNAAAPNPWRGYRLAGAGDKAVIVMSIPVFLKGLTGLEAPLKRLMIGYRLLFRLRWLYRASPIYTSCVMVRYSMTRWESFQHGARL